MNKVKYAVIFLFPILFSNCSGQELSKDELFIPDFKWNVKIPDFLIAENADEWKKVQNNGKKAFEDTYDTELKNKVKTIFIFKSSDKSFFEAVSEPITKEDAENYAETCERMNDIIYNTIKTQVPAAKIDTTKSLEVIDGLVFQTIKVKLDFPDGLSKTSIVYRRVFEARELTVSVMYSNQTSGDKIMKTFLSSKFVGISK